MAKLSTENLVFDYSPFQVEAGKIKEFALALGIRNPIYFDKESAVQKGYRDIPAPPTFATVIDYWNDLDFYQMLKQLELKPEDVLHGEQTYEYIKDIFAGEIIFAQVSLKKQYHKKGKNFFFLETIYKNQNGEIVLISRATLIQLLEVTL
ncbi:MaoC family dehydratase N-terminal domain-containing protein [Metabacillus herbersteinensis]|uniref:MaoC family dehydratase N-terminal domain-containing protein n=1 Tax=Metabacillus herbersteinensis TaxID=283816 RepID=A0ABV6GFQ2_9BACI